MRIDVIDRRSIQMRVLQCVVHRPRQPAATGIGCHHIVAIRALAPACNLSVNCGTACGSMFGVFEHKCHTATGGDETIAACIKRTRRLGGVTLRAQRPQRSKG